MVPFLINICRNSPYCNTWHGNPLTSDSWSQLTLPCNSCSSDVFHVSSRYMSKRVKG
jgi:hypothetical protein